MSAPDSNRKSPSGSPDEEFSRFMNLGKESLGNPASRGGGEFFDLALKIKPADHEALRMRALAYEKEVDCTAGIEFCRQILNILPDDGKILTVLGNLLGECGRAVEGIAYAQQAIASAPQKARPYVCLAFLQDKSSDPLGALKTLESVPVYLQDDANLQLQKALILRNIGRSSEAATLLQNILQRYPSLSQARSNFLLFLHDIPGLTPQDILRAHREYDKSLQPAPKLPARAISAEVLNFTEKPVIGFVSSDLREHSVAYFLLPLLKQLHSLDYKVHLFDNNPAHDETSLKLRQYSAGTHIIRGIGTRTAAENIRECKIDILFDLNGHTAGNRLDIFRMRPAPVQTNWLGYPDTTGLDCMDYRFVDEITDPYPQAEPLSSEKLVRLRAPFICYQPPDNAPEISPPPFKENGFITFGSFNNFAKTNPQILQLWAKILEAVPDSRLLLKGAVFSDEESLKLILPPFLDLGINPERIILHKRAASTGLHLQMYSMIDIALDTFPYNGTTTTCEALYMGVPVLTLCGINHCARVGASLLQSCGLNPLVSNTPDDYLQRAVALSNQQNDLENLRIGMRHRLLQSPLTSAEDFAQSFVNACKSILIETEEI